MSKLIQALVLVSIAPSSIALAAPVCSVWLKQIDGSYWRECINDDGKMHCYSAKDDQGANATEISCKK